MTTGHAERWDPDADLTAVDMQAERDAMKPASIIDESIWRKAFVATGTSAPLAQAAGTVTRAELEFVATGNKRTDDQLSWPKPQSR